MHEPSKCPHMHPLLQPCLQHLKEVCSSTGKKKQADNTYDLHYPHQPCQKFTAHSLRRTVCIQCTSKLDLLTFTCCCNAACTSP